MSASKGTPLDAGADTRGRGRAIGGEVLTPLVLFGLTILMVLASRWISPSLGGLHQVAAIIVLSTFLMVVAFGQQMVVLIGGLDLSVPSMLTLGGILTFGWIGPSGLSVIWVLLAVLIVTGLIGALSGVGVALLRIPPFIMTLAMGIIVYSGSLGLTAGTPRGHASVLLGDLFSGRILGLPPIIYGMIVLVVLGTILQSYTPFGRRLYALGTSPAAAHVAGLAVNRLTIATYAISAASAGFAGFLLVGYAGGATLVMGQSYLLPSIAAIVVGGTSILGGRGNYISAVAAALLLTTFSTIISSVQILEGWRTIIYGLVILLAIAALREDLPMWIGRGLRRPARPPTAPAVAQTTK
ncbi:ABC transporter permease [Acidisoma cladoniae]|uniref:ABC transporter permease n=1 Tax=Acidisoma cladoniae TaxID=3040935 RepID=UPI00254F4F5B|nr:ABC transporter permease [Acidisoma sp. PAMC 29798]